MTRGSRKQGRPPIYVLDAQGKPVVGLSMERKSGRFYRTGTHPRHYLGGRDRESAIMAFRAWEARHAGSTVSMFVGQIDEETAQSPKWSYDFLRDGWWHELTGPSADALYAWARAEIVRDASNFAQRAGLPAIAKLAELPDPEPTLSLAEISRMYAARKAAKPAWTRKALAHWSEFMTSTGVKTLAQLRREHVTGYHDALWKKHDGGKSPAYIRQRLTTIRAILNYAMKQGRDAGQLRRVLDLCKVFTLPRPAPVDPKPISPATFGKLLEAADLKWRAILLLALNAAMYGASEVARLRKTDIDLEAGVLAAYRDKTGLPRLAALWPRTVEAVREYQAAYPHGSEYLFVNRHGKTWTGGGFQKAFELLRERAGVECNFSQVRDGAATAAVNGRNHDEARLLLGHKTAGALDHYAKRDVALVRGACKAIESAFFPVKRARAPKTRGTPDRLHPPRRRADAERGVERTKERPSSDS